VKWLNYFHECILLLSWNGLFKLPSPFTLNGLARSNCFAKVWKVWNGSWPSGSGLRGRRRTYLTILKRVWSADSKMVRLVLLWPLRPELDVIQNNYQVRKRESMSMATLAWRVKRGGGGWVVGSPIITRRRLDWTIYYNNHASQVIIDYNPINKQKPEFHK
jgi:hypothetical protein